MIEQLSLERRQEIFRTLVALQDAGSSADQSRAQVSAQFLIAVKDVRGIEREGISQHWPPL